MVGLLMEAADKTKNIDKTNEFLIKNITYVIVLLAVLAIAALVVGLIKKNKKRKK